MALESGKYTIVSKLDDAPVGRRNPENLGTDPKGIFKRPNNVGPQDITTVSTPDVSFPTRSGCTHS